MTTSARAAANRRNALRSTGPRTPAGKARVALNKVQHGLRSEMVVIPFMESAEDWEVHRSRIAADLAPDGYLETVLADRVASLMWRLGRATRYEREKAALLQEQADQHIANDRRLKADIRGERSWSSCLSLHPEDARWKARDDEATVRALKHLSTLAGGALISGKDTGRILEAFAREAKVDLDHMSLPGIPDDIALEDLPDCTARIVRAGLKAIAEAAGNPENRTEAASEEPDQEPDQDQEEIRVTRTPEDLLRATLEKAESDLHSSRYDLHKVEEEVNRYRRENILPDGDTLEKVTKYETTLERSLFRTLHELQRLQAARSGANVPPPVAVDVDVSGGGFDR